MFINTVPIIGKQISVHTTNNFVNDLIIDIQNNRVHYNNYVYMKLFNEIVQTNHYEIIRKKDKNKLNDLSNDIIFLACLAKVLWNIEIPIIK